MEDGDSTAAQGTGAVHVGLVVTPAFFQRRMETFSECLWKFVLAYIDDIIVYSRTDLCFGNWYTQVRFVTLKI
jgi:hypothetical protein